MTVRNAGAIRDDGQQRMTDMLGHIAGYAVGGVLLAAILYAVALYLLAG